MWRPALAKHYLEPTQTWEGGEHFFYRPPNAALTKVLTGSRMNGIVSDAGAKVVAIFAGDIASRPHRAKVPQSETLENTRAEVKIGGYKNDRWVCDITVGVDYAAADHFGRKRFNPYQGSYALTTALYSVLPQRI